MRTIRLVRSVFNPDGHGPRNGMCALQKALAARRPEWLEIGGELRYGEIPWFWCWLDQAQVTLFAQQQWPFICGPNMLFADHCQPGLWPHERAILDSPSCLLQFTESTWYATLIRANCTYNKAPIVLWAYPIEPQPDGPLPAEWDVLVYHKMGEAGPPITVPVCKKYTVTGVYYGDFKREELIDKARRSRCCLYLSDNDRGPLALAEIMLAGCPAVGTKFGAPWIEPGISGVFAANWYCAMSAIEEALILDREKVRKWAVDRFCTGRTVETILEALEPIAKGG
jgi:hypothetical protein